MLVLEQYHENTCCVCFVDYHYIKCTQSGNVYSLAEVESSIFKTNTIPDNLLIKSACNIHFICIGCIYTIINNYDSHPINEENSHFACPYPFESCETEIGFKNIFDHSLVKKICKTDEEWLNYTTHAERYAFPGFTIIKCPLYYIKNGIRNLCNCEILVENEHIKTKPIGDLIIQCSQNESCLKKFCYSCKEQVNYYINNCNDCKTIHENENPNLFNYYFNKNSSNDISISINNIDDDSINSSDEDDDDIIRTHRIIKYEESDYLYLNSEITVEIAVEQISALITDVNLYMICAICKTSIFKTERCNGLSHHNLERCYACGRIGYQIRGLGDHWNNAGISGCFRFNYDNFVNKHVKNYMCSDTFCHSHDKGDCTIPEHQDGINNLNHIMKKSYIFHLILSLLPKIRFDVYNNLYERYQNDPDILELLPFKQTLIIIEKYKKHVKDYNEDIVYQRLLLEHPMNITEYSNCKNYYISTEKYFESYSKSPISNNSSESISSESFNSNFILESTYMSAWRSLIYSTINERYSDTVHRRNTQEPDLELGELTSIRIDSFNNNTSDQHRPLLEYRITDDNNTSSSTITSDTPIDTLIDTPNNTRANNTIIFNGYSLIIDNYSDNYEDDYDEEDDDYLTE